MSILKKNIKDMNIKLILYLKDRYTLNYYYILKGIKILN